MHAVVYVNWSVAAGQFHGQWGCKYPGLLQVSLRPEILNYCPAGSAAEFDVNLVAASHFFFFSSYLNFIFVYRGGYIVVTC